MMKSIKSVLEIDFDDESCCFSKMCCFEFENYVYEDNRSFTDTDHDFRYVFSTDDYDYVEDEAEIKKLTEYRKKKNKS